ncbi:MAG: hypothetical protein ACKO3Q_03115 [Betaproteobacteria bacterium]
MWAGPVEQTVLTLRIPEQHQILAQQTHRLERPLSHDRYHRGVELVEQGHRLPIVAHQAPTWGTGPDTGDAFVEIGLHGLAFMDL